MGYFRLKYTVDFEYFANNCTFSFQIEKRSAFADLFILFFKILKFVGFAVPFFTIFWLITNLCDVWPLL